MVFFLLQQKECVLSSLCVSLSLSLSLSLSKISSFLRSLNLSLSLSLSVDAGKAENDALRFDPIDLRKQQRRERRKHAAGGAARRYAFSRVFYVVLPRSSITTTTTSHNGENKTGVVVRGCVLRFDPKDSRSSCARSFGKRTPSRQIVRV